MEWKIKMAYFFVMGEDIEGNYYEFESAGKTLIEVKRECQELLETLDGGHFDIYENNDEGKDIFIDDVEW